MDDNGVNKRVLGYLIFDITHVDAELIGIYGQYLLEKTLNILTSRPDLSSESFFWRRLYHQHDIQHPRQVLYPRSQKTKESITIALSALRSRFDQTLSCLDCGCGPTSQFYTTDIQNNSGLRIITVDPLAEVYGALHRRYQTGYDLVCLPGYGEKLKELFSDEEFHLVYSQNAIDHSQDPRMFFANLYAILKPGGFMVLHGFVNEGSAANWLGLHKWNIEPSGDDLLLSNRDSSISALSLTTDLDLRVFRKWIEGGHTGDQYTFIYERC